MKKKISFVLASFFGIGYLPVSGTAGSLAAMPVAMAAVKLGELVAVLFSKTIALPPVAAAWFGGLVAILALAAAIYFVGVWATREVLKYTEHDPSLVVIDEVVGLLIACLPIPIFFGIWWWSVPPYWVGAFLLFRLFDIWKPWPVRYFDRKVLNASGVMLDDVMAGIMAAATLSIIIAIA
ncbi:MAG: phosphatidylglycerophosphatase A [Rickettsiales bacterium]|jgi:phosphatidylglycerophosphatase A|nr:phosphatidylglycerophosphatase A [Rickettsiales bacterium]